MTTTVLLPPVAATVTTPEVKIVLPASPDMYVPLEPFTVIGAVRFDFGYRLNRTGPMEPEPNSHYAFHLSIGEAF